MAMLVYQRVYAYIQFFFLDSPRCLIEWVSWQITSHVEYVLPIHVNYLQYNILFQQTCVYIYIICIIYLQYVGKIYRISRYIYLSYTYIYVGTWYPYIIFNTSQFLKTHSKPPKPEFCQTPSGFSRQSGLGLSPMNSAVCGGQAAGSRCFCMFLWAQVITIDILFRKYMGDIIY